jgi:serine/threonine-protein kinase RIM15
MLSAPRDIRQAQWGLPPKSGMHTTASSPGEDLPPVPMTMPSVVHGEDEETEYLVGDPPKSLNDQSSISPSMFVAGAHPMGRTGSAGGQIGGVEWVDWMDEYKRYKAAKIRADSEAAKLKAQAEMPPPPVPAQAAREASSARSSPIARESATNSPKENAPIYPDTSAIDLTPSFSRDEPTGHLRRRSMSIRSQISSVDRSPSIRKLSLFEKPRQTSNGSSSSQGIKKKKNLVNKMEGWWNAVKSNFTPETSVPHQVRRPSNLGVYAERRVPSAPASRRSSGKSGKGGPETPPPAMMRRDTSHSLRNATSVAELRSPTTANGPPMLADPANITASVSGGIVTRTSSMLTVPSGMSAYSTTSHSAPVRSDLLPVPKSGLEARRRQPNLRLELESHVLTQLPRSQGHSSNGSVSALPAHLSTVASSASASHRPSAQSSRSSSYANSTGPGLTPGVQPWEQTPSPIFAMTTGQSESKEEGNDPTIASVRRHVKHRLNGAKETCDRTLHKVIALITRFADDTRAQDDAILEEKRRLDEQRDYFENISDSPLMDEESDFDGPEGPRSRNGMSTLSGLVTLSDILADPAVSSSRGPSRRASVSRPSVASSPTRRTSMLPSSPNRPTRRRPSVQPRNYVGRDRVHRAPGLALDRTRSGTSSRSTSRSHSPMPIFPSILPSTADIEDDVEADRQFLASLQELIVIATDVLESSVNSLLSKPSACTEIIQKLQRVGQHWDEHDDWPGRNWYVEILMAVAGLRRILDWWETEKGFWAFEDDDDENEPLLFVLKPKEESKFDQEFREHNDRESPVHQLQKDTTAVTLEAPSPEDNPSTARAIPEGEGGTPKAADVEDLRFLAEHAKMVNIVMELGLQGEEIQYVNDAIMEVAGQDPEEVLGQSINDLLAPADANAFAEATQKLLEDDNNTVQMRVRIEVRELDNEAKGEHQPGPVYVEVEGVGMLMRENNEPSHTMWVLKPVTATCRDAESTALPDASFPVERIMSNEAILCRICEREIVSWFFEKHNETCDAVHRLEAEVSDCNECLHDLGHTLVKLKGEAATGSSNPQALLFYSIPECLADNSVAPPGPQGVELRKISLAQLEETIEVLKAAEQVETPVVRPDEADLEFNVQRYLPRESEDHLVTVSRWQRPHELDRALVVLYNHVETQLRRKHKAIARMQSTIRYSEKTRHEWEDKVNKLLDELSDSDQSGSDSEGSTPPTTEAVPDVSPPNQRKIAPQARIPITQGHPQRPSTGHGVKPFGQTRFSANRPTTSNGSVTVPRPKIESAPPSAALIAPARPEQPKRSRSSQAKPSSPLMVPTDRMSHGRRVSTSRALMSAPLSPRIPSAAAQPRANPPSIKDFEIIKPISRGAFGSVYLAKKVATGDYFAIKALKKSDMIAKNQITNVKAERTILMNQSSSPYVTKLFFSFQSKEYLYLVMEYLNGGDCASLVKTLGGLPEEWARNYIAEVVLGLEYLHERNIVHR